MPFQKGNQLGKARKGHRKDTSKTVWLLESLRANGFNYETMLVKFLGQAAAGDKMAYDMAALLIKMVPHIANAPKTDHQINQIETLVINRFEAPKQAPQIAPSIEAETVDPDEPADL